VFSSLVGAKLVFAAVAGSLSIGGVAAAAVTGSLPGPIQHAAHGALGVQDDQGEDGATPSTEPSESTDPSESASPSASADPSASASPSPDSSTGPVGPDATGPAAFGLCHAFGGTKAIGKADSPSIAYRNLLSAATTAGQTVEEYCAVVLGTPVPTADVTSGAEATGPQRGHGRGHGKNHHS
jgi:hypothetical protein